ncbi:MAG: hypothetical protein NTX11_01960 [Candidatus Saccharibacteria bacterium]|nr:hypothetical protein [Candidatus Saccharibacteria bacterium]
MEEVEVVEKKKKQSKPAKKVTFTITFNLIVKLIIAAAILLVLFGVYTLGTNNGKKNAKTTLPTPVAGYRDSMMNGSNTPIRRWSAIATITAVDAKKISFKDSAGKDQTANFTKETLVMGSDGKKTDIKALKKDQKIIISGDKDQKGENRTVTRIRIQK